MSEVLYIMHEMCSRKIPLALRKNVLMYLDCMFTSMLCDCINNLCRYQLFYEPYGSHQKGGGEPWAREGQAVAVSNKITTVLIV